jgi:hypothetical protein
MVLMAPSEWNNGGKKQQPRLWQCTRLPSVKYPHWTVLYFTMLASMKFFKWAEEQHLDAFLTSADVIVDQRDEPG